MSLFSWLRDLASPSKRKKAKKGKDPLARHARLALHLETLEDRFLPVAYTWTALAAGTYDWTNPANWNVGTGFPNGPGDTAALNVALTGNIIIQIPTDVSLSALTVGPTGNFTQTIVSTGGSLTIDAGAGTGVITNVGTANVTTFNVAVHLASDVTINNNTTRNLNFSNINLGTGNDLTVNAGNTANTTSLGNITGTGNLFLNRSSAGATTVANIAISGNVHANISGTGTITVSGDITGNAALSKTGTGTGPLILTGNNSYSGTTTVSAGVLQVGNGAIGQLGSGDVLVGAGATLAFGRTNAFTVANNITGSGAINLIGAAGNMTIPTNLAAFNGTVTVSTGSLNLRDNGSLAAAAAITMGNGNINLDNQLINLSGRLGLAPVTFTGTGSLTLVGANNTATVESLGPVTLANGSAGGIRSRKGTGTGTNSLTIASITRAAGMNQAQLTFDGGLFIGNGTTAPLVDVGGNNSIVITDTTGLESDGIIPFAMTTVNGTIAGSGVLGNTGGFARLTPSGAVVSATTVVNPTNLTLTDNALYTANTTLFAGVQQANSVFIALTANRLLSGPNVTLQANTIGAGFGAFTANVAVDFVEFTGVGTAFSALGVTNLTFSGNITGAGNLTKEGLGNVFLPGDNFFFGAANLNAGILVINGNHSLAGTSGINFSGGTLRVVTNSTALGPITVNMNGGAIQASTASTVVSFEGGGTLDEGANLTITGAGDLTFDSMFTGMGAMNLATTGVVDWRVGSAHTGGTTLAGAAMHSLRVSADGASGPFGLGLVTITNAVPTLNAVDGPRVVDNAFVLLNNLNFATGFDLLLTGNMTMNAARTFTVNSTNVTFAGALTGGFGITKAGVGSLTLTSDDNVYTSTTITGGIFQVGNGVTGSPGNTTVAVSAGATAIYNRPGLVANQTAASGAGNWQVLNGTNLTFTAASSATGNWIVNGNGTVLTFTGAGTAASGNITVGPGSTLRYGNNVTPTGILGLGVNIQNDGDFYLTRSAAIGNFLGRITGSGNFTFNAVAAAATISLVANNSYTGNTTINAPLGTTININGSLPNTPNIVVNSGTALTRISLNNTLNAPRTGRFGLPNANISLNGTVTLELLGNNTLDTSESLGSITLHQLANVTFRSSKGNAGGNASLTLARLTKASDNVMLVFDGAVNGGGTTSPLSAAGNNTITITNTSGLPAAGTIIPYAMVTVGGTVNGNGSLGGTGGFATLSGNRIVSATSFVTSTRFDAAAPTPAPAGANVLVLSNVTLAGDTNILNSVFLGGTVANTLAGAVGNTLNVRHIGAMGGGNVAYVISVPNVNLGSGATPATYFFNATGTGNMQINGIVSGSGGLNKEGLGTARALFMTAANNTYTGVTTVNGGFLEVRHNNALGAAGPGNHTVVGPNAQLSIGQGDLVVPENITMNGSLLMDILGNNTLSGTVTFTGNSRVSVNTATDRLTLAGNVVLNNANLTISSGTATSNVTFAGPISGIGSITQNSTATTIFAANNSYLGNTTILSGVLVLGNNSTAGSFGNGAVQNNGTVAFARIDTFAVANNITGNGSIVQVGNGGTILTGNNNYSGNTTVLAGSLFVNGAVNASNISVALDGTLGGGGVIGGDATVNGTLAPGVVGPAAFSMVNLTFADNARFALELGNGLSDRINVLGNVTIGNNVSASFSTFGVFSASNGTSIILIDNDDVDPIVGQFLNLPEGTVLTNFLNSGFDATITYVGGDGNDFAVAITGQSNVPPTLTPANGTLAYVENDGPRLLDNTFVVADANDANLAGATIVFTAGYQIGQDALAFSNQNGINGTFHAANGTLSLSGVSSVANYQTALRSITYINSSDAPSTANRTLSILVSDGVAGSSPVTRTITVSAVNDAPTLAASGGNATFTALAGPIVIDNLITIADLDSASITGASIAISANFTVGQDVLAFTNTANITGVYNAANGTLALAGTDTLANYQAALRSVTYNNTAGSSPSLASRTISFQVNDGGAQNNLSNTVQRIVAIHVTQPPVVTANQSFALAENSANGVIVGTLAATDPDGPSLQNWMITGGNIGGAFALNTSSGQLTVANPSALDRESLASFSLTVTVSDGLNTSTPQTVVVHLTDVNDVAPVVTAGQSFAVVENSASGTVVGTVAATDGDISPTTFQNWAIVSGNPGGAFAINLSSGQITVNNITGLTGSVVLGVAVSDGVQTSPEQAVTVNLLVPNSPPNITANQSFSIAENSINGTLVGVVAATDSNANTTFQGWAITAGNTNGAFAIDAATGQITVANFAVLDREAIASFTLTLTVSDGTDTSPPQNVTIQLTDVNDLTPVVTANQTFAIAENSANGTTVGAVLATDGDVTPTTFQTWTILTGNTGGAFAINPSSGVITIANSAVLNREAIAAFALGVTVSDGVRTSAVRTVTIQLTDVNDVAPVVTANQTFAVAENSSNGTIVGTAVATDGDVTATIFQSWAIVSGNTGGAFAINSSTGQITVANAAMLDREAIASFALGVTVSDGVNTSALRTVTVNVSDVNDVAPVITANQSFSVLQGAANGTIVGNVAAADGDVTATTFQNWAITAGNTGGAFSINTSTGQITVANSAAVAGGFSLTLTVSDGVNTSMPRDVIVNVTLPNPAPTITPANGSLSYVENDGARILDNAFTLADDGSTLTSARIVFTSGFAVGQDVLTFSNQSGITGVFHPANGTLTLTGNATLANYQTALRSITYTNNSENPSTASRILSITVNDGTQSSTPISRMITVASVNDAPVLTPSAGNATYAVGGPAVAIDPGLTLTDLDSRSFTGAVVTIGGNFTAGQDVLAFVNQYGISGNYNAASGTLTLSGAASLIAYQTALRSVAYVNSSATPNTAPRTITFRVNDGGAVNNLSNLASRTVRFSGGNQPPVIAGIADQTMPPTQDTLTIAVAAHDPDGGAVTLSATVQSQMQALDAQLNFAGVDSASFNYGRLAEKWIFALDGANNRIYYFILPNGDLFRWDGTPFIAQGTFIANVGTGVYADPNLLVNPAPAAAASFSGSNLTIDPAAAFRGRLLVTVQAVDPANNSSTASFQVLVAPPPVLSQPADQNVIGSAPIPITLSAVDPSNLPLTFSAQSEAALLKALYGLSYSQSPTHYFNFLGQQERWMIGAGTNVWYYVKPSGELFRWVGATGVSTYVRTIDTRYYSNPAMLYNASSHASISIAGNQLTVTPGAGFVGKLVIVAAANNGVFQDAKTFTINVS
jgi:autotransporter-associated beta strand protein